MDVIWSLNFCFILFQFCVEQKIRDLRIRLQLEHKPNYSVNKPSQPDYVYKFMVHTQNRYDVLQDSFSDEDTELKQDKAEVQTSDNIHLVYGLSLILFITIEDFPTQSVYILSAFDNQWTRTFSFLNKHIFCIIECSDCGSFWMVFDLLCKHYHVLLLLLFFTRIIFSSQVWNIFLTFVDTTRIFTTDTLFALVPVLQQKGLIWRLSNVNWRTNKQSQHLLHID
jgi:hypothetical protein